MEKFTDLLNGRNGSQNKFPDELFKNYYMGVPVEHDEAACTAWKLYYSLHHATTLTMHRIAEEYGTTVEKMREHKRCNQ
jgi:hypothetical protein